MTPTLQETRRTRMVDVQLRARHIHDERVLTAMSETPRELFVPAQRVDEAYEDRALPIALGQTISQPYMVARLCELAALRGEERVLEIGTGSGYQAAILAKLAAEVISIERHPSLARQARLALRQAGIDSVQVIEGDGSLGYAAAAPYDCIVVTAGAPMPPPSLLIQLAEGGRLVIPVGPPDLQRLRVFRRQNGRFTQEEYDGCVFVPLVGEEAWEKEW